MGTNGVEAGGGPAGGFPTTAWSLVVQLSSEDDRRVESVGRLFTMYHGAILAHLRRTWRKLSFEEIEDRASAFFASLLEKDAFRGFDATKARFRTYLKMLLDRFARDAHDEATALRRGGGVRHVSYHGNPQELERVLRDHESLTPEEIMDEMIRHEYLTRGLEKTRAWADATDRSNHFEAFRLVKLDPVEGEDSYQAVADRLGLKRTDVNNRVHGMRERLKQEIIELIKPTVASQKDAEDEFEKLFG